MEKYDMGSSIKITINVKKLVGPKVRKLRLIHSKCLGRVMSLQQTNIP